MKFSVYYKGKEVKGQFVLNQDGGLVEVVAITSNKLSKNSLVGHSFYLKNLSANKDYRIEYDK